MLRKDEVSSQPLWKNYSILIDSKPTYLKTWCVKSIRFINDILASDGSFLSVGELEKKFVMKVNYLHYLAYVMRSEKVLTQHY